MAKKGQGISINVIVIAAIALVVLVILSVLVIRSGGTINRGGNCAETGGTCIEQSKADFLYDGGCPENQVQDRVKTCTGSTKENPMICCRAIE